MWRSICHWQPVLHTLYLKELGWFDTFHFQIGVNEATILWLQVQVFTCGQSVEGSDHVEAERAFTDGQWEGESWWAKNVIRECL